MRGTIRKREYDSGAVKWRVRLRVPVGEHGEKERLSKTFETKREAERYRTEINHQMDRGTFFRPSNITIESYMQRWVRDYAKPSLSPTTLERYVRLIETRINPALGHLPISSLSVPTIQDFYHELRTNGKIRGEGGLSEATIRQIHYLMRGSYEKALDWRLVEENPFQRIQPPQVQNKGDKIQYLDQDQTIEFLKMAADDGTYYPLYHLAVLTGLRKSELYGLRWKDIDFETKQASIQQVLVFIGDGQYTDGDYTFKPPKTDGSSRTIALTNRVIELLGDWQTIQAEQRMKVGPAWKHSDLVVTNTIGRPIDSSSLRQHFHRLLDQADLPRIRFHDLRHTHATLMLKKGEHPKVVSERLGHSSVAETLDTYSHVLPNLQEEAAQRLEDSLIEGLIQKPAAK